MCPLYNLSMKKFVIFLILILIIIFTWSPWVTESFAEKIAIRNNDCPSQISDFNKKMFGASITTDCGLTKDGIARVKIGFVTFWGSFIVTAVSR